MDVLRGVSSPALVGERQFYVLARVEAAPNHQAGGRPYIWGCNEGAGRRLVKEKHHVRGCKALQYFDIQKVIIMPEKKPEDVWRQWQGDKTKDNMGVLLNTFRPMIQKEVTRHAGQLPQSYLEFEAKKLAFGAFETFDPSKAGLSTHVAHKLRGLGRVNYTFQNALRMPEERQRKYSMFMQAKDTLKERFGRDPSSQELSEELLWAPDEVGNMERVVHKELPDASGAELALPDNFLPRSKVVIDYLYHDMSPEEKIIFEGITGYNGHPVIGAKRLARKLNISEPQMRRKRDKLVDKLKTLLEGYG